MLLSLRTVTAIKRFSGEFEEKEKGENELQYDAPPAWVLPFMVLPFVIRFCLPPLSFTLHLSSLGLVVVAFATPVWWSLFPTRVRLG